jgi:hypothetical protein
MPCSCGSLGCADVFGDRLARREVNRFRKRGLDPRSGRLLDALAARVRLAGARALEVGAGAGGLTVSMLERGVAHVSIIDAAPAYIDAARRLATERGVADALSAELGDYADTAPGESVDFVVMDRVVCCYPSWRGLRERASAQAGAAIALAYPRPRGYNRFGIALINGIMRLRRSMFRVFVHPPQEMHAFLERRGFAPEVVGHTAFWELVVAVRAG